MDIKRLKANFEVLPDWVDRYRFIIDLGNKLPAFPKDKRTEHYRVHGCQSQVWLSCTPTSQLQNIEIQADSDAHIVKGLIAILLIMFSNKPAAEIITVNAEAIFEDLGLTQHLSPSRSNGLVAMVKRIRRLAQQHIGASSHMTH